MNDDRYPPDSPAANYWRARALASPTWPQVCAVCVLSFWFGAFLQAMVSP